MYIHVVVKPEVGEIAYCFGILRPVNKLPFMEAIEGFIVEVDDDWIRVKNISYKIPIYRVVYYTFGGIRMANDEYDQERVDRENQSMYEKLMKDGKLKS